VADDSFSSGIDARPQAIDELLSATNVTQVEMDDENSGADIYYLAIMV